MRKKIVAGNWKMNKTHQEGMELLMDLFRHVEAEEVLLEGTGKSLPEIVIAPPFILLSDAAGFLQAWEARVAAQNCSSEKEGAHTGEVSALMLKSINTELVIVGHSERRAMYGDTNVRIAQKIDRVLENGMRAIVCIGETLAEREAGKECNVITHQLEECLFHLPADQMKQIVLAYEPVWAIGTGKNATAEQAQEMHQYIRSVIHGKFGKEISEEIRILYGGSCNPSNAAALFACPDVDGGLIGGASLKAADFTAVIKAAVA